MTVPYRKKLIEVALPLEAINRESAREKSIRHGHPSTLHLWWARRPLAAARAVLFAQLVDDPSAWPERFPTAQDQDAERKRLFNIIEAMVKWEASIDENIMYRARLEIAQSWARTHSSAGAKAVMKLTPEALDSHDARTLVDRFLTTEVPPVHDPFAGGGAIPLEAQRLGLRSIATDINPVAVLVNKALGELPPRFAGLQPVNPSSRTSESSSKAPDKARKNKTLIAREWRGAQGLAEDVKFYGAWLHATAKARIGHLYPEVEVTQQLAKERPELKPQVGEKLTVIAWLWARTVATPDPAFAGVRVPLVSSFWLSMKNGKKTWIEPVIDGKSYRFEVRRGEPKDPDAIARGTKEARGGFRCLLSGVSIPFDYVRAEAIAGRLGSRLMAVVLEGKGTRFYLSPTANDETIAASASPNWLPEGDLPAAGLGFRVQNYGLRHWAELFTQRQLVALTTFSDLVEDARATILADAQAAGLKEKAQSYADAVATYLALGVSRYANSCSSICSWNPGEKKEDIRFTFTRQALSMTWDYAEGNPFSQSSGNFADNFDTWLYKCIGCGSFTTTET